MHLPRRALAVSALALGTLVTATGCTATNAQQTAEVYAPGATAATTVGQVHVAGMFVSAGADGAALVARIVNSGDEPADVEIAGEDAGLSGSFTVEAGQVLDVGPGGAEQLDVPSLEEPPGSVVTMTVSADGSEPTEVSVPVLDGTLEQYAQYVPTATPTPTPTATPTPRVTGSPSATGTRTGTPSASESTSAGSAASRTPSPGAAESSESEEG